MKTFIVQGCNWNTQVEINDEIIEKYVDMACEATTQAIEIYLEGDSAQINSDVTEPPALGPFMSAHEKGHENDEDKVIVFLTEHIC